MQKEEKKSESEEVVRKSEAQNPRVGHNNATPTVSAPQALTPNQIQYHQWNQGGQQELISLTPDIWTL